MYEKEPSQEGQSFRRLNTKSKAWEQYFQCRVMLEKQGSDQVAYTRVSSNNQSIKMETRFRLTENGIETVQ